MGKRQIRIFSAEIPSKTNGFLNKELNLVLSNGKTIAGTALSFTQNTLTIKDHFLQKHNVRLEEIEEIVLDFVAPY